MELFVSGDGCLLQKKFHKNCLKYVINVSNFRIPQKNHGDESYSFYWRDNKRITKEELNSSFKTYQDIIGDENPVQNEYYAQDLFQYDVFDPEKDMLIWYDDIRALSGSAGYVHIRNGYVHDSRVVVRS